MHATDRNALPAHRSGDMHEAGRIAGSQHLRAAGLRVLDFFLDDANGHIGEFDGERAAEAAAVFAIRKFDQFAPGFCAEQLARFLLEAEAAEPMTGVMERDSFRKRAADGINFENIDEKIA